MPQAEHEAYSDGEKTCPCRGWPAESDPCGRARGLRRARAGRRDQHGDRGAPRWRMAWSISSSPA